MINSIKKNKRIQILLIQGIFLLFAIGFACGSIYINRLALLDSSFHYSRIIELSKDLQFGRLPAFNLNSMVPYGDAIPTFYPWVCLLLVSPLIYIIHSVTVLWSIIVFIIMLLGLEVAYYSSNKYFNSNLKSFIFSVLYCFSTISMSCGISDCDMGEFLGILLAPLVIFGWLYWLKNCSWKMMTIGLILMLYSHILSSLIICISLAILTICFYKSFKHNIKKHLVSLVKGLVAFILATSIVWLPLIIIMQHNNVEAPVAAIVGENSCIPVIPNSIGYLAAPYMFKVWTFSDLACVLLSLVYWKKVSTADKRFVLISIFYIFLNFKWIKIPLLTHTPLVQIQFMCRICFISHLLFSIVLVNIIVNILLKKWYIQNVLSLLGVLLALNVGSVYLTYAGLTITKGRPASELISNVHNHHKITKKQNNVIRGKWKANNYLYNTTLFRHGEYYVDYLPLNMIKHNHNKYLDSGIAENNKDYVVKPKDNGVIQFYMGHNHKKLLMPMTMYNKQKYYLKLDGKYINPNKNFNKHIGYVELHNIHKGWHKVQLIIPTMNYRYIAVIASLIGLSLLLILKKK